MASLAACVPSVREQPGTAGECDPLLRVTPRGAAHPFALQRSCERQALCGLLTLPRKGRGGVHLCHSAISTVGGRIAGAQAASLIRTGVLEVPFAPFSRSLSFSLLSRPSLAEP